MILLAPSMRWALISTHNEAPWGLTYPTMPLQNQPLTSKLPFSSSWRDQPIFTLKSSNIHAQQDPDTSIISVEDPSKDGCWVRGCTSVAGILLNLTGVWPVTSVNPDWTCSSGSAVTEEERLRPSVVSQVQLHHSSSQQEPTRCSFKVQFSVEKLQQIWTLQSCAVGKQAV